MICHECGSTNVVAGGIVGGESTVHCNDCGAERSG